MWSRHTVIFDANGGTFASTGLSQATLYAPHGDIITGVPEEPTREGYKFNGWSTSPTTQDLNTYFDLTFGTVNDDIILYAWWIAE